MNEDKFDKAISGLHELFDKMQFGEHIDMTLVATVSQMSHVFLRNIENLPEIISHEQLHQAIVAALRNCLEHHEMAHKFFTETQTAH